MGKANNRLKSLIVFTVALVVTVVLAVIAGQQLFRLLNRTPVESFFIDEKPFGIALIGQSNDKQKEIKYITIVSVYAATQRVGFVSFYPRTKLSEESETMSKLMAGENAEPTIEKISELLSLEIPYRITMRPEDVSRVIDLVEGVPYFLWSPDILATESLPTGEFMLDGALVKRLIEPPMNRNEYSPAFQLFRHNSLILNLWHNRVDKWTILSNPDLLDIAVSGLSTNLGADEILFLGDTIWANRNWMPAFFEIPVKRIKDDFVIDTEATMFYYKTFKKNMLDKVNPFAEVPPKMEIKNGTEVANLARELRNKFASRGVQVIEFANADRHDYRHSILVDTGANAFYLETVARMTGIKRAYSSVNRAAFTDMVLILGRDYKEINFEKKKN